MDLSEFDLSILGEIGNISVGGASTSLSDFVNKIVTISIPETKILTFKEIKQMFEPSVIYTKIDYKEGLNGLNLLLMKKEEALAFSKIIVKEKLNKDIDVWDDFAKNVLGEAFNIMVGNMSSAMSTVFNKNVKIKPPSMYEDQTQQIEAYHDDETVVTVWFDLKIEDTLKVRLVKIISEEQSMEMIRMIKGDYRL